MEAEVASLQKILEKYEKTLIRRAALAYRRSPADFFDDLAALELVMDLRRKLRPTGAP